MVGDPDLSLIFASNAQNRVGEVLKPRFRCVGNRLKTKNRDPPKKPKNLPAPLSLSTPGQVVRIRTGNSNQPPPGHPATVW
jgi:hypothetical protein